MVAVGREETGRRRRRRSGNVKYIAEAMKDAFATAPKLRQKRKRR